METAKELAAGCVGGIVQVLVGQPFDTVKVRLQTQPEKYSSMLDCIRKTRLNDGLVGFYKGTLTPLVGIGACVSIQFGVLESAKRFLSAWNLKQGSEVSLTKPQLFGAGALAGFANSFLCGPIEHIRTRLQVQTSSGNDRKFKGPIDLVKKVYNQYGIKGVFKGQYVTILRESLGFGIYFLTYETLMKNQMSRQGTSNRSEVSGIWQCLFGAISGYMLWISVYPIDSIKSRIQTDFFSNGKYSGIYDCFKKVYKAEGPRGFYKGFVTCMIRAGPVNGATFLAYETALKVLAPCDSN